MKRKKQKAEKVKLKFPVVITLIFVVVVSCVYIKQKIYYHKLLFEYKSLSEELCSLKESSHSLKAEMSMLNSSKRVLHIAKNEMNLKDFGEDDVIYLRIDEDEQVEKVSIEESGKNNLVEDIVLKITRAKIDGRQSEEHTHNKHNTPN